MTKTFCECGISNQQPKHWVLHVNWRCLRTFHATWLVQAGADPKSVQAQRRHSRISTTMEIYAQIEPATSSLRTTIPAIFAPFDSTS